jgi:hypothetical protein
LTAKLETMFLNDLFSQDEDKDDPK